MNAVKTFVSLVAFLAIVSVGALFFVQPANAQSEPVTPTAPCVTIAQVLDMVVQLAPDAEIKEVNEEDLYIIFSSPNKPTDLKVTFDEHGCAIGQEELSKVTAEL
jgi:hypothetical protein